MQKGIDGLPRYEGRIGRIGRIERIGRIGTIGIIVEGKWLRIP